MTQEAQSLRFSDADREDLDAFSPDEEPPQKRPRHEFGIVKTEPIEHRWDPEELERMLKYSTDHRAELERENTALKEENRSLQARLAAKTEITTTDQNAKRFIGRYIGSTDVNGLRHGAGHFSYAGGAWYQGEWETGLRHGKGTYAARGVSYEGNWLRGEMEGKIEIRYQQYPTNYEICEMKGGVWHGERTLHSRRGVYDTRAARDGTELVQSKNLRWQLLWRRVELLPGGQNGLCRHGWVWRENEKAFRICDWIGSQQTWFAHERAQRHWRIPRDQDDYDEDHDEDDDDDDDEWH